MAHPATHAYTGPPTPCADATADRDAAANRNSTADPVNCDCADATADSNSAAQAHATTNSDSNYIAANSHASANSHSSTRANAAAHTDSPADADPGQPGRSTYPNAVTHLERRVLRTPPVSGAAGHADRHRYRLGV